MASTPSGAHHPDPFQVGLQVGVRGRSRFVPGWRDRWAWRRGRPKATGRGFGQVCLAVASALEAGASPAQAWSRALGAATDEVRPADTASGLPAVLLARAGTPAPDAAIVASLLADRCGVPVAAVLRECAAGVAEAEAAAGERRRALAGPAATARLLAWLPVACLLLSAVMGVDAVGVALDGGLGSMSVALGLGCVLIGRVWSRRLVRAAARVGGPS